MIIRRKEKKKRKFMEIYWLLRENISHFHQEKNISFFICFVVTILFFIFCKTKTNTNTALVFCMIIWIGWLG